MKHCALVSCNCFHRSLVKEDSKVCSSNHWRWLKMIGKIEAKNSWMKLPYKVCEVMLRSLKRIDGHVQSHPALLSWSHLFFLVQSTVWLLSRLSLLGWIMEFWKRTLTRHLHCRGTRKKVQIPVGLGRRGVSVCRTRTSSNFYYASRTGRADASLIGRSTWQISGRQLSEAK